MEIKTAILDLDDSVLASEEIFNLSQYYPTPAELKLLEPHTQNIPQNLGNPEKFFIVIKDISGYQLRLKTFHFKLMFYERFNDLKKSVETLLRANKEVRENLQFIKILEIILAFGNFLNCSTNRGGAFGFKIQTILKLIELPSHSDPKKTILHYIIEYTEENVPEILNFYQSFETIEKASLLDLQGLQEDMNFLKKGNIEIDEFLLSKDSDTGQYKKIMSHFVSTAKNLTSKLDTLYNAGLDGYTKLIHSFGEHDLTIQDFFGTLDKFCLSFVKTKFEIQDSKAALKQKQFPQNTRSKIDQVFENLTSGKALT